MVSCYYGLMIGGQAVEQGDSLEEFVLLQISEFDGHEIRET